MPAPRPLAGAHPAPALLALLLLLLLLALARPVASHGLMCDPPQRGVLAGFHFCRHRRPAYPNLPRRTKDVFAHFPSGDKSIKGGSGMRSQIRTGKKWQPYDPFRKNFPWRAGVCGDMLYGRDHLRGGRYYTGLITNTYREGSKINIESSIVAHHNGFIEIRLCNVAKCGGEISRGCFQVKGACVTLKRYNDPRCVNSRWCAPKDPKYPHRFYLPCRTRVAPGHYDIFGAKNDALFQLPEGFHGPHIVLQWFWSSANTCNPPGVREYYNGKHAPKWGNCPGQGGARGGIARQQPDCGPNRFTEEYYQCSDIRILPKSGGGSGGGGSGGGGSGSGGLKKTPIKHLTVVAKLRRGRRDIRKLYNNGGTVIIGVKKFVGVAIRADIKPGSFRKSDGPLRFFVRDGSRTRPYSQQSDPPYYMNGDSKKTVHLWKPLPLGRDLVIIVRVGSTTFQTRVKFTKWSR